MAFITETLKSWDQIQGYARLGWLFRGEKDPSWNLRTALERFCNRRGVLPTERRSLEHRLDREFRRAYHQYALHVPPKASTLEWFSLMQHYGAPTRLLDFTYSIFVAMYFALEASEGDCIVWGINGPWAMRMSKELLRDAGKDRASALSDEWNEGDDAVFDDVFLNDPVVLCACPLNPFRLNERLRIQMGVFMVPGRVDVSFEENLCALRGHELKDSVIRIVIPSNLREETLRKLFDMGLSRRTLFPGLDGYAQSLAVYSPALNPVKWD